MYSCKWSSAARRKEEVPRQSSQMIGARWGPRQILSRAARSVLHGRASRLTVLFAALNVGPNVNERRGLNINRENVMSTTTATERHVHVILDGPDGVGISTQRDLLVRHLRALNVPCLETANPSEGQAGLLLRDMLLHNIPALAPSAMQRLYVSDRDDHYQRVVAPALARGEVIIQARGEWSTVVYNAARAIDVEDVAALALNAFAWHDGLEIPTLTIVLVADLEVTEARRGKRGGPVELFDGSDFQARVIALYSEARRLAKLDPAARYATQLWGPPPSNPLVVIDASGTEEEVHARVIEAIVAARIIPALESTS